MTDGTVTQKPKYHCIASEHEGPMRAEELRVFYGQLWCSDCWYTHAKAGKHWDELDRFADVPAAEQQPAAWARMKGGKVADAFADRKLAEFVAGFAANKLVPLYLRPQPAPDTALAEAFDAGRRAAQDEAAEFVVALEELIAPTKYKRDELPKDDPNHGDYASWPLQVVWLAWQASRAASRKQGGES